jgi:hypothetical protein
LNRGEGGCQIKRAAQRNQPARAKQAFFEAMPPDFCCFRFGRDWVM